MASIEAFCSQSPKFPTHKLYKSPKLLSLINPLHNFKPQSVQFQHIKLHFSPKPSHFTTQKFSELPTSKPSEIDSSRPTQKAIFKFLSEKIVLLLVGSFVFMGCFSVRPSLAVSVETSTFNEETRETRKEEENERLYDLYLEQNPNDVNALKVVMYRKMRSGKTEEAVKLVERLIGLRPDEVEWRLVQALCYETIGHLSKAKRLYKEILEKWPLLLRALHGLAMVMRENHEGPAVFEMLNEALEMARRQNFFSEERTIRILIALFRIFEGELEESLAEFQDLIEEDHRDSRPYLLQGIVYSLLDKKEEAEGQYEIYWSLVPEEFPERGYIEHAMMAAKTSSRKDLKFSPNFRPSLAISSGANMSSEEMGETRKKKEQEKLNDKYLEQNPIDVNALKVVMYRKMRSGKTQEAVKLVERLIGLEPYEVEWRLEQACCYETIGHLSKAKRLYKEILEKWPLLLRALNGLALILHENHEGPAAFEMLNKALETARRRKKFSEERSIRILIAQMRIFEGELEESLGELQDLIKEDHRDFRPHLFQGIVYNLLDRKEEAEEQLEIYRSLLPEHLRDKGNFGKIMMLAKTISR